MPDLIISLVPKELVHLAWPDAAPLLEKALALAPGRFTGGDLFLLLSRGDQALWVIMDGDLTVAAFTTRIYDVPLSRVCCVEWLGGERLMDWVDEGLDLVERYARDCGCNKIENHGRPGWGKVLKKHGWRPLAVSHEKDLT